MTKAEFKKSWESDADGGGITFDDVANCAKDWGISSTPKTRDMNDVLRLVLSAAGCKE